MMKRTSSMAGFKTLPLLFAPLLAACLALLPLSAQAASGRSKERVVNGVVTHVTDGDTLWVRTSVKGEPYKVRMTGIDAPESCQPWGAEATAALASRVKFKTVQLRTRAKDDYGRMLAVVTLDRNDIGRWMVESGHAWSYHRTRTRTSTAGEASQSTSLGPYGAEETQARSAGHGLWSAGGGAVIEPRNFRKQHGACPHRAPKR